MKELLARFQRIYDELKDQNEIAIAAKYTYSARRYTIMLSCKTIILHHFHKRTLFVLSSSYIMNIYNIYNAEHI